nr:Uncharacterised protein [Raoultella sp. NCTC 9187]
MKLLSQTYAEVQAEELAFIARDCLIDEARLSPKAGSGGQPGKTVPSRPHPGPDGALGAQPGPNVSTAGPA